MVQYSLALSAAALASLVFESEETVPCPLQAGAISSLRPFYYHSELRPPTFEYFWFYCPSDFVPLSAYPCVPQEILGLFT